MDNVIKLIEVIGKQWPFILVIFLIIVILIKWKTIWSFIASLNQITLKRGNTAIELNRNKEQSTNIEIVEEAVSQENTKQIILPEQIQEPDDGLMETYFDALKNKEFETAKVLFSRILEKEENEDIRKERKLNNFFWRHHYGDTTAFSELESYVAKIDSDDEHKSISYIYLGSLYSEVNNYPKAIEMYKIALSLSKKENRKAICIKNLSEVYLKNGNENLALNILFEHIKITDDKESLQTLYLSFASFYSKKKDKLLESIAYQKALELTPNDKSITFNAAYSYSEMGIGFHDLGLLLYKRLLLYNPNDANSLNNIGVSYKNLDLNIKSVDAYKTAFEFGNSLAGSNLAYLLISLGFSKEAEEYLQKSQEMKDIHDNIFTAKTLLNSKISEEKKLETNILTLAEKKYLFFEVFGNAMFKSNSIVVETSSNWIFDVYPVNININNDKIVFTWEVDDEKHNITGFMVNNSLQLVYKKPKRNSFSYSPETKYTFTDFKGYGYISSSKLIKCSFDIEKEYKEFIFKLI